MPLLLFGLLYITNILGTAGYYRLTFSAINRLCCLLPQEFALFAVFAGAAALIEYFRAVKNEDASTKLFNRKSTHYLMLLETLGGAAISVHIYSAFIMFIVCFAVFLCFV